MRIVADSSCELTEKMKSEMDVTLVPLTLTLGDRHFRDDETLDVNEMLKAFAASKEVPKSACPSPQDFIDAYTAAGSVFVVTMTAALSGTYNSAILARDLFIQEQQEKFIHVFNSKGSSVRETLIALKIDEMIKKKLSESEIVKEVNHYIDNMSFFFQLGSLDTMIKNGRISKMKGIIANALNIRPILTADENGEVKLVENVRSETKSIQYFVDLIGKNCMDQTERILGISHCDALDKAEKLKAEIEARFKFKEVFIVPMRGLSSTYTNRGGITLGF